MTTKKLIEKIMDDIFEINGKNEDFLGSQEERLYKIKSILEKHLTATEERKVKDVLLYEAGTKDGYDKGWNDCIMKKQYKYKEVA